MIDQLIYDCPENNCKGKLKKHLTDHLFKCSLTGKLFIRMENEFQPWTKKLNFDCR